MRDKETHLRRIALEVAGMVPFNPDDAAAVLDLVREILKWRDGGTTLGQPSPQLTVVPFRPA